MQAKTLAIAIAIATALFIAPSLSAQTTTEQGPIHEFRIAVLRDAYLFTSDASTGNGVDVARRGQQDLDRLLPRALGASQGHEDLTKAVKAFYLAAKTYFDSADTPTPLPRFDPVTLDSTPAPETIQLRAAQAQLKADVDSKANALELEAKLAGLDG